jgi:hypothetical protein
MCSIGRVSPFALGQREADVLAVEEGPYTPSCRFPKDEAGTERALFFPGEKTFDHVCPAGFAQLLGFLYQHLVTVILEKHLKSAGRVSDASETFGLGVVANPQVAHNALGCTLRAGVGAGKRGRNIGHESSLFECVIENGRGIAVGNSHVSGAAVVDRKCLKESVLTVGHGCIA